MSALSGKKSKKSSGKSRPASTSALNAPSASAGASSAAALDELSAAGVLSAFSAFSSSHAGGPQEQGEGYLALLSQAIDRHRLRVYAVSGGVGPSASSSGSAPVAHRLLADYILPNQAKCNALAWVQAPGSPLANGSADASADAGGSKKKKRRKSKAGEGGEDEAADSSAQPQQQQLLALGLDNGSVQLFSPRLGKVAHVLADSDFSAAAHGISAATLPLAAPGASSAGSGAASRGVLHVAADANSGHIWTASADGVLRVYDLAAAQSSASAPASAGASVSPARRILPDASTGVHVVAPSPSPSAASDAYLAAHHSIRLFAAAAGSKGAQQLEQAPRLLAYYTGHATPLTHLVWLAAGEASKVARFVSAAEEDRSLYVWGVPAHVAASASVSASAQGEAPHSGSPLAIITLDAAPRHVARVDDETLLVVDGSGSALLFDVPADLAALKDAAAAAASSATSSAAAGAEDAALSKKALRKKRRASALAALPTLKPASEVRLVAPPSKGAAPSATGGILPLIDAAPAKAQDGALALVLARLVRGSKLAVERAVVRSENSASFTPLVELTRAGDSTSLLVSFDDGGDAALGGAAGVGPMQRFADGSGAATGKGKDAAAPASAASRGGNAAAGAALSAQLGLDDGSGAIPSAADLDALIDEQAELGMDLDEPTLAQRLKSMKVRNGKGRKAAAASDDEDDEEDDEEEDSDDEGAPRRKFSLKAGGGASLAQALTQALHSGDSALLTSALVHGDPALIRASVSRLSGPLAVRLLEHCIERMNKGANMTSKGALGSQRARTLIEWVRITLVIHTAYFMSLPNLVTRLFHLHSALLARLASQDKLLELQGRLELVLAQIELRATYDAAQAGVQGVKAGKAKGKGQSKASRRAEEERTSGQVWVESDAEDDDDAAAADAMSVEEDSDEDEDELSDDDDVEQGEEEGETQDIALGAESDDGEEEDGDDSDAAADNEGGLEAMEDNAVVSTPEGSEDEEGGEEVDEEEEEYDEDADEAGSLEDFIVGDEEVESDLDGDSDDLEPSDDDEDDEPVAGRRTRATVAAAAKRKSRAMMVDDEAEETSDEGTGPDDDEPSLD